MTKSVRRRLATATKKSSTTSRTMRTMGKERNDPCCQHKPLPTQRPDPNRAKHPRWLLSTDCPSHICSFRPPVPTASPPRGFTVIETGKPDDAARVRTPRQRPRQRRRREESPNVCPMSQSCARFSPLPTHHRDHDYYCMQWPSHGLILFDHGAVSVTLTFHLC